MPPCRDHNEAKSHQTPWKLCRLSFSRVADLVDRVLLLPHAQACQNKAGSRDGATQRERKDEQASPAGVAARPTAHGGSSDPVHLELNPKTLEGHDLRFSGSVWWPRRQASISWLATDGCLFPVSVFTFTLQVFIHTSNFQVEHRISLSICSTKFH